MKSSKQYFWFGMMLSSVSIAQAGGGVLIKEDFTAGPGCLANLDADVFSVSNGALAVGTNVIRTGCGSPPGGTEYRHALCSTNVPSDFVLDVDVQVVAAQENRAGIVYGWTGSHN